jgi:hypothetical protein
MCRMPRDPDLQAQKKIRRNERRRRHNPLGGQAQQSQVDSGGEWST